MFQENDNRFFVMYGYPIQMLTVKQFIIGTEVHYFVNFFDNSLHSVCLGIPQIVLILGRRQLRDKAIYFIIVAFSLP